MKVAEKLCREIGRKSKFRMLNIFQYAIILIYFTFCLTAIVNILYLTIKIRKESQIYFCSQNLDCNIIYVFDAFVNNIAFAGGAYFYVFIFVSSLFLRLRKIS